MCKVFLAYRVCLSEPEYRVRSQSKAEVAKFATSRYLNLGQVFPQHFHCAAPCSCESETVSCRDIFVKRCWAVISNLFHHQSENTSVSGFASDENRGEEWTGTPTWIYWVCVEGCFMELSGPNWSNLLRNWGCMRAVGMFDSR